MLQRGDLPAGFGEPVGQRKGSNIYNVAYLRLQALTAQDFSRANLLGIVANVGIYQDGAEAFTQFEAQGGLTQESVEKEMKDTAANATDISASTIDVKLDGTNRMVSFRVAYTAGNVHVIGYRYRFTVTNAVANVFVISRVASLNAEPAELRDDARDIALRQVNRLLAARN